MRTPAVISSATGGRRSAGKAPSKSGTRKATATTTNSPPKDTSTTASPAISMLPPRPSGVSGALDELADEGDQGVGGVLLDEVTSVG